MNGIKGTKGRMRGSHGRFSPVRVRACRRRKSERFARLVTGPIRPGPTGKIEEEKKTKMSLAHSAGEKEKIEKGGSKLG